MTICPKCKQRGTVSILVQHALSMTLWHCVLCDYTEWR